MYEDNNANLNMGAVDHNKNEVGSIAAFKTKNRHCKHNIRIETQELRVILTNKTDDLKQEVLKKQDVI